jgi:glycosyltransferase involved in cell wall biosynthesis
MRISVVIPHLGRDHLLADVLEQLNNQSFDDFDVILVFDEEGPRQDRAWYHKIQADLLNTIDSANYQIEVAFSGGRGPATARNIGAKLSESAIILFIGSDCYPHRDLVAQHYYWHMNGADIVQGYTPWHQDVITPFYDFLDDSGLQANWETLKNEDGSWKHKINPAFCLTTNYSINRQLFLNGPFDERFTGAAWEDISLGYRLSKYGNAINTIFNPEAINYHYHRYDLKSFLKRSNMEGYHRLTIAKIHPEMAWQMMNPYELRIAEKANVDELVVWAQELDTVDLSDMDKEATKTIKDIKYRRYYEACHVMSLKGVLQRIEDEHPAMQALKHVHKQEQVIQIVSGVAALDSGHLGYAKHTAEWFMAERSDDWSSYAYAGEVELAIGNKQRAIELFQKSVMINDDPWPRGRLNELSNI